MPEPEKPSGLLTVGRFAPSPTGPLHIGGLLAAAGSWLFARRSGGRWLVRMEDLDTPRVVSGSADSILRDLERFGLTWDGEIVFQSERLALYEGALSRLQSTGSIYHCACSRAELRTTSSAPLPRAAGGEMAIYPGTCRAGISSGRVPRALRFRVPEERISFTDAIHGQMEEDLTLQCGDFVVRRADGPFAYQLAVVVDDAEQGVTQVVRGGDLLASTPRQIALQRALGYPTPAYSHLPLLVDGDGVKLGKRAGALGLQSEMDGVSETLGWILGMLGCGEIDKSSPEAMLREALDRLDPDAISRDRIDVTDWTR